MLFTRENSTSQFHGSNLVIMAQAVQSGKFKDVAHMRGGIYSWYKRGLPIEGKYDGGFAGRTPSVVEEKVRIAGLCQPK